MAATWLLLLLAAAPLRETRRLADGRKEMLRACQSCHPLDVIRGRRFPREDWDQVLRKMTNLGVKLRDREALLDYLSAVQGEKAPPGAAKR